MVAIFEQYLKVASLKDAAERMQQKEEDPDDIHGGDVPDIGGDYQDMQSKQQSPREVFKYKGKNVTI